MRSLQNEGMTEPQLSLRIDLPNAQRFGPGKAALLEGLIDQATIKGAAEALGMSYPRALKLSDQMNATFTPPLVETSHGGVARGGASVTPHGREILRLYKEICEACQQTSAPTMDKLAEVLSK